ncbi:MAG: tape measure protein [Burkholderiaceae bacterium]
MSISLGSMDVGVAFVGDASGLQSATTQATAGVEKFGATSTKAMRQVAEDTAQANAAMQRLATGLKGAVVGGSLAVGLVKLKNSITEMSAAIIDAQVQLDKWNNGFKFGAGSMAAGTREMAFVREEAQRLGLELSGSATQYMKLVAASRGTTMEGEKTRSVFTAIAEAATVMGMSSEQSERAFMAITQMMSKGKVQAEELRGQLGEHLPGAFAIAARAMGVTEIELNKLMETGNVMSADFLPKFGAQLRKELAGSVEDATKSMQASLNRYETAWLTFKQNVAQSGVSDFIGGQINILSDALANVSTRIEDARGAGGGFWAQTAAGAAGVAQFINPLNAFSYSAQSLDMRLKEAQESLVTLQERAKTSPESPFFRVEIAQTQLLIKELQRAAQAKAMLDVAPGPTGSVASGDSALARANQADYEKRLAAYKGLMASMANPQEKFNAELVKQKALLGDLFTPDVEARLRAHYIKPVGQAREKTDEFAKALESLQEKATGLNTNYSETLATLYQGLNAGRFGQGEEGIANYRAAVESLIKLQPFFKDGLREEAEALKASQDAMAAKEKATAEYYDGLQKELGALSAKVEALQLEGQEIGLTAEGLLALTLRRLDDAIATEQQALALASLHEASGEELVMMQRRIELLKEQRALTASNGQRQIAADAAKDAAEEWKRASQQIEQSLTDALMRGFESGKGPAEVLRDTVVNMFKTMVLRPVIQATVQGGLNAVGLGLPGGQGSGLGSSVLGNAASNYATSTIGTAVFGSNAAYGAALGTTSIGGGSQAAMLAAQTGEFGAAGLAATAQAGGGAMASFAAAAPWVLGALAVASILSSMDDSGTLHTGGMASYSATGGLQTSTEHGAFGMGFGGVERGEQTVGMVSGLTRSTVGMLDSTSKLFGGKGGYSVATGFADDSSRDSAWGGLLIKDAQGNTKVNWNDDRTSRWAPREFADGQAGAQQYALAVAKDVRDVLIDETPAWADTMLNALGDAPTLEQLAGTVAQIHAAAAAFDTMGRASEQFAALSESAMDALVTAMGGAEAAVAGLGNYYSSFYTDAERADVTRSQLQDKFTGLGLGELPQTREQFRSIVESLDLTTVSGREMYAELIKLSPAFASITEATQDAGAAMAAAAEQAARAAEQAFEKAKTTAYSQLEASAERERALWEQQASAAASLRDEVRGVFDTLATNIRELRGEALGPELTAAQGQAFINGALASVNAGTGLPDGEGLANAIAAVRGGLSSPGMYANSMERDFAALRLAGELSVLQEAAGEQLTTAELQLQAAENQIDQLDETLAYWRKLIDGTEDGIDATKSVEEAVKALTLLMFPEDTAAGGAAGAGAGGSGFVIGGTAPGSRPAAPPPAASTLSRLGNTYYGSLGTAITDAPSIGRFDSINTAINTFDWSEANKPASVAAITTAAVENGATTRDIAIATGLPLDSVNALFPNIPRYLLGTNYVPETGLALLHKGEAVVPQAYNPMAGAPYQPTGMGDSGQVVALLQQIAARVAALEGHAATSADANAQSADVLTRVAQGNALTTAAAPAIA